MISQRASKVAWRMASQSHSQDHTGAHLPPPHERTVLQGFLIAESVDGEGMAPWGAIGEPREAFSWGYPVSFTELETGRENRVWTKSKPRWISTDEGKSALPLTVPRPFTSDFAGLAWCFKVWDG